jgi:hypothetical protein
MAVTYFDRSKKMNVVGRAAKRGLTEDDSLAIPQYDQSRIAGLAQEQMAPALSELRRGLTGARSRRYATPTARREAMRGAYRGAGESLGGIQAAATQTARGLYQPEYQREVAEWNRQQREIEREEERAVRMATPIGGGGGESYRSAYERQEAYDPFGAMARFDARLAAPAPENVSYGASPQDRARIEAQAMEDYLAVSGGGSGYDPSNAYGG